MIGKRNLTAGEAHIFLYWTVCSLSITTKTQNIVLIFYLLHVFNPFYLFQCSHTLQVLVHWGGGSDCYSTQWSPVGMDCVTV